MILLFNNSRVIFKDNSILFLIYAVACKALEYLLCNKTIRYM